MKDVLRPILELTVILPGLLLSYFPVKSYLKQSPGRLAAWVLPLLAGFCTAGGLICDRTVCEYTPDFPVEIRVDCTVSLRSIFMHQQPVQSRQRSNCDACTGNGAGAVVLL